MRLDAAHETGGCIFIDRETHKFRITEPETSHRRTMVALTCRSGVYPGMLRIADWHTHMCEADDDDGGGKYFSKSDTSSNIEDGTAGFMYDTCTSLIHVYLPASDVLDKYGQTTGHILGFLDVT